MSTRTLVKPKMDLLWVRELRAAGYNPSKTKFADEKLKFTIPSDPSWRRGCVIGEPCGCTGWKAIMERDDVEACWLYAHIAIVVFTDGRILKYEHNGLIPNSQDITLIMTPPGDYYLNPVRASDKRGRRNMPTNTKIGAYPQRGRRSSPRPRA